MNKALQIILLLTTSITAVAADFKYHIPLKIQQSIEATGYVFQLPQEVYQHAQDSMLRDVRVKNAQGDEVPMRLNLSEDDIKQSMSSSTLPIFSLNHTVNTPLHSKQVTTSWQGDEQQFSVKTSESVQNYIRSQEQLLHDRFLLDASLLKQAKVSALALTWQFDTPGNRVFYVEVKGSHDLSNWQTLYTRHKLIELNTGQRVVLENTIPIHGKAYDYYQLRFLDQPIPAVLEVKALMNSHELEQPLMRHDVARFKVLDPEVNGHSITWDTGGFFPVETVEVDFNYKNLMADVQLYSRASEKSAWQLVISSQFYQVGTGEMAMEKNQLSFHVNNNRYWKLSTQSTISSQWINNVSWSWRPHQLQFLAQGNGPYDLYFGADDLHTPASSRWYQQLNSALSKEMFSTQIKPGALQKLKSEPAAETVPESQVSRWVFWGLLVVVLSALFYMASRLMKEVSEE
jgi:hypothetical protein